MQTPNVPLLTYSQWELFETLTNGKSLSYSYSLINIAANRDRDMDKEEHDDGDDGASSSA